MPLINGQKMACEPCIRGHRSTKCSHANERLMVPVRRPGRPLSSCPHPPSRPCLCAAAVTAAIPKKQKCRCDTSQPVAANGLEVKTEAAPGADVTPLQASSSKGSETPGHRVQKSVSKSKAGKKPIDPAALERMDASQVNIVSPFDAGLAKSPPPPPQSAATTPGNPGYGVMQFVSPEAASAAPHLSQSIDPGPQKSVASAVLATSTATHQLANGHRSPLSPTNGHSNGDELSSRIHSVVQSPSQPTELQPRQKSCCCSKAESTEPEPLEAMRPAPAPETTPAPASATAPAQEPPQPLQEHYQMSGGMMNPLPAQMPLHHGMFPFYPHTSVFAYPPHCGSYLQPLQPEQWRHLMANTTFSMPVADPTYDHYTAMPMPAMHQMSHMNGTSWTSHQCGCGDSCQCIGCASHPYNEATQNYVRSAWNMMMEESPPQQKPNSHHEADHGTPMNHTSLQNGSSTSTGASMPAVKTSSDDAAPPSSAGRTPTDSAGPASASAGAAYEEQILSANDFFFVSYPFRMCEGEIASCPCGDDCACNGCVMHSRPASQAQL